MLLGVDFNCTLNPADTTGTCITSRALMELIRGLSLIDTWMQDPLRPVYMHFSPTGATRIDSFYISKGIQSLKTGTEIVPAPFTDQFAVVIRISSHTPDVPRQRWRWRTNPEAMHHKGLQDKIRCAMGKWRQRQRFYDNTVQWWERCVKVQLQKLISRHTYERHRDAILMENHLYECIYNIIKSDTPEDSKFSLIKRYNAKIIRHHATRRARQMEAVMLDTNDNDKLEGEEPFLFHQNGQP
jgi:hypothetical protein